MSRNSIITLVLIVLIHERCAFALRMNVCFIQGKGSNKSDTWCTTELKLCRNTPAYDISFDITEFSAGERNCTKQCLNQSTGSQVGNISVIPIKCNGESNCSLADISPPSTSHGGILTLTFVCNNTDDDVAADNSTTKNTLLPTSSSVTSTSIPTTKNSTRTTQSSIFSTVNNTITTGTAQFSTGSNDPDTVAIVVSVVVLIIVVVVVVAFLMYRRGQCKLLLGKCTKKAKHSPDRTDTYAMSSEANANFTYDFSSDIDVWRSDVDYCEIDKVGQETGVKYNHVDLKKTQVAKDPTYNHIEHLNSSPGNTEHTYNHVGDETFQNTGLFTLQPDTYSHIGAMTKPASEQLADDSYAHISGVKQYIPEVYDINQYDCAVFQQNGGPTEQEREMNSGKEKTFNVVRPGKMDSNDEDPVPHSYFVVEKHEKEA